MSDPNDREAAQSLHVLALWKPWKALMPDGDRKIEDLRTHPDQYVTVFQLARYWRVGRKQIYKQIDAGTLPAIRLGPRLLRIRTVDAIRFERMAKTTQDAEK
jgi:excisionase family DNA binding protein